MTFVDFLIRTFGPLLGYDYTKYMEDDDYRDGDIRKLLKWITLRYEIN